METRTPLLVVDTEMGDELRAEGLAEGKAEGLAEGLKGEAEDGKEG